MPDDLHPAPLFADHAIAEAFRTVWQRDYAHKPGDAYGFGGWCAMRQVMEEVERMHQPVTERVDE